MNSKIFFRVIEIILFLGVIYLAIINYLAKTTSVLNISTAQDASVQLSTFCLILLVYFIGCLSGFVNSLCVDKKYKDQIAFYARRTEKLSQQNEIDTDDKEALQRKIASLEIALNNALQNNEK